MELVSAHRAGPSGGLTLPAISHVFTITYVAEMLGEDEEWLWELQIDMFAEDGCLRCGVHRMLTVSTRTDRRNTWAPH